MLNPQLANHLMTIADDSDIRQGVYDHVGEYCHQCRNCLNSLKLCLYLARRQVPTAETARLDQLERRYAMLERSIDQIQLLCRPIRLVTTTLDLSLLMADRIPTWKQTAASAEVEFAATGPDRMSPIRFDPGLLGNALDALVSWRMARLRPGAQVGLHWASTAPATILRWVEQGTEFPDRDPSAASEIRADWALPTIKRVVEAHAGRFMVDHSPTFRLRIELPNGAES